MPTSEYSGVSGNSLERNYPGEKEHGFEQDFIEQISTQQHVLKKLAEQNRKDTWDSYFDFLLFLFTFSNGTPQVQMAVSICTEMTGGIFFSILIALNFFFIYPILTLELFFGSFTKFTFGQIWQMAPIFHGFGVTYIFLYIGYLLITALNTAHSLIYTATAITVPWFSCPNLNDTLKGRYEIHCISPFHENVSESCVLDRHLAFNCSNHENLVQFSALFYYWQTFCDPDIHQTLFLRNSFLSHAFVWGLTCFFLFKGRAFISKLVLASTLLMLLNVLMLVYFLLTTDSATTYEVMKNVFAIRPEKLELRVVRRIFWYVIYKTPVGFPNIYMTSTAYYNLNNLNPTKYASLLIIFGDLYLMAFIMLLNFMDNHLSNIYGVQTSSLFLTEDRGVLFATIPEYLSSTNIRRILTHIYFWALTLNLLSHHVNTAHVCLLNVFDYIPRYKELKIQVIFPFCVAMFLAGLPLSQKNIVYCVQNHFIFLMTTYGSVFSYLLEVWIYIAFYGIPRINNDFLFAFGKLPPLVLRIIWFFIPLCSVLCVSLTTAFDKKASSYCEGIESFVDGYYGILMSIVVLGGIIKFVKSFNDNNISSLIKPTCFWGPPIKDHRLERKTKTNLLHQEQTSLRFTSSSHSSRLSPKRASTSVSGDDSTINIKIREILPDNPYERNWMNGMPVDNN